MKNFILSFELYILKALMSFIYFFIKLFPMQENKIIMISRQTNQISMDFKLLKEEFEKRDKYKVVVLCKMVPKQFWNKFKYCFFIIKCMYHIATSHVCIVDGYVIPVSTLKHKKGIIIIQIWHAMGAIKKFGKQILDQKEGSKSLVANIMKMHQNYDCIFCTSDATKKFYEQAFETKSDKILVLGMPRVDYILDRTIEAKQKKEQIQKQYLFKDSKKIILYVPTFRKNKSTHIQEVIQAFDTRNYKLIIKLHPLEHTKVDKEYLAHKDYNTMDLLKIADYVITDYSAIAFEAAILNKPIFFYLYDIEEYAINRGLNINLQQEMKNSTFKDISKIIKVIENEQYDKKELQRFKEKYVQTSNFNNTEKIVNYITNLMNLEDKKCIIK